jgi:N-acetylglutamate synthase-like GNAT family acetyltransferase
MDKHTPKPKFSVTTDIAKFDLSMLHGFLTYSYWAKGISLERVKKQVDNSLCFGVFFEATQIGFARIISDFDSFAYVTDVFIVETYRGIGLAKQLLRAILRYPSLQNLRRWMVTTKDAHGFFSKSGFAPLANTTRWMEIYNPKAAKLYDKTEVLSLKTEKPTMKLAFKITTNTAIFNSFTIHQVLSTSYWAQGITLERVRKRIDNTLCFGVFADDAQVGFARVITDFDSFAYLADVFILEGYQGIGLSKHLLHVIIASPQLKQVQRWLLCTRDAHGLYQKFGFEPLQNPKEWLEICSE